MHLSGNIGDDFCVWCPNIYRSLATGRVRTIEDDRSIGLYTGPDKYYEINCNKGKTFKKKKNHSDRGRNDMEFELFLIDSFHLDLKKNYNIKYK